MSSLKSRIDSLASLFVNEVVSAIHSASLEELLGEVGSAMRGRAPRANAVAVAAAPASVPRQRERPAPRPRDTGRLARRSPEDIKHTLDRIHGLLRASKGGLRSEQIRAALKLDVREMPRVLKEGLAKKSLKSRGQKRSTTYFAA
jgi:hypothetical protein